MKEMDEKSAVEAINGGLAIIAIGIASTLFFAATGFGGDVIEFPEAYFDVGGLLILGFFLHRKSRVAAVLTLVYFVVAKGILILETGKFPTGGIVVSLIFVWYSWKAILGTLNYHRIMKTKGQSKTSPLWLKIIGGVVGAVAVLMITVGIMTETSFLVSTEVQPGDQVLENDLALLKNAEVIASDEEIEFLYSSGFQSVLESGYILLQDTLIIYYEESESNVQTYRVPVELIKAVNQISEGGVLDDSVYRLSFKTIDDTIDLSLPTESNGDDKFIQALVKKLN